jgi:hypothetical protein
MALMKTYRALQHCRVANKAEIMPIEEGMRVGLQWINLGITIGTGRIENTNLIKER